MAWNKSLSNIHGLMHWLEEFRYWPLMLITTSYDVVNRYDKVALHNFPQKKSGQSPEFLTGKERLPNVITLGSLSFFVYNILEGNLTFVFPIDDIINHMLIWLNI